MHYKILLILKKDSAYKTSLPYINIIAAAAKCPGKWARTCLSFTSAMLIDVSRSSGISERSTSAFALSASCQTVCNPGGSWRSSPFHSDEWLFSSVLVPSYEKADLVRGRLYEAIKNVCQSPVSNVRRREGRAGMVIRLFSATLNSFVTASFPLIWQCHCCQARFFFLLFFHLNSFHETHVFNLLYWQPRGLFYCLCSAVMCIFQIPANYVYTLSDCVISRKGM